MIKTAISHQKIVRFTLPSFNLTGISTQPAIKTPLTVQRPIKDVAEDIKKQLQLYGPVEKRREHFAQVVSGYLKEISIDSILSKEEQIGPVGGIRRKIVFDSEDKATPFQIVCFVLGDCRGKKYIGCIHDHLKSCGGTVRALDGDPGTLKEGHFEKIFPYNEQNRDVRRVVTYDRKQGDVYADDIGGHKIIHQMNFSGKNAILLHLYFVTGISPNDKVDYKEVVS